MSEQRDLVAEHLDRRDIIHGGIMDAVTPGSNLAAQKLKEARISFVECRIFFTEEELWNDRTTIQDRLTEALDKYFALRDSQTIRTEQNP